MCNHRRVFMTLLLFSISIYTSNDVLADNNSNNIQQQLNQQVLSQPIKAEDDAILRKDLEEATKLGKPSKSDTQTPYYQYYHNGYYYPYAAYRLGYWW